VFVYDDGPITDYTKAFPVHQEEDAPACVGAVSNLVLNDEDSLSKTQLAEMENAGWEIMSHTVNHQALSPIEVTADISAGDRTIQVKRDLHSWEPGNTILITSGDRAEKATVSGGGN
jgi:peptidoglycan/xylan/chitin deacetylase (PgdA/CDA1 family)